MSACGCDPVRPDGKPWYAHQPGCPLREHVAVSDVGSIGDPSNPFHRASFYLEQLKYGEGPKALEPQNFEQLAALLDGLLRDAGVTTMTGAELVETLDYYADSYQRLLGLHRVIAKSIFTDGVQHGIAFAAGLAGEVPE